MRGPLQPKRFHYSTAGVKVRNVKTPTPFSSRKTVTPRRFLSSRPGRNLRILNSSSEVLIRWILQILNFLEFYYNTLTRPDRKSTRLNSSHVAISYAVFCLKKKQY